MDLSNPSYSDNDPLLDQPTAPPDFGAEVAAVGLPPLGTLIGRYELKREIARGAMGVVYLAWQHDLRRYVALKMILVEEGNQKARERFESEAQAAAALDHPGIVPVFDVGSWRGRPYFAMGYVEGPSLLDLLRDGPLLPERAALLAKDLAVAIGHAHQKRVIHRDLKPANILLADGEKVRITDFGVSKLMTGGSDVTSSGELIGTPHYMPPEQARGGSQPVSAASDIYSLGGVLYAMLTGRPPFVAPSPVEVVGQVVSKQPIRPSALIPSVPHELEVITLKCLNKKPADRYQAADALADDLSRWLRGDPILAKPPGVIRRTRQFVRQHLIFASVSGSASLGLIVVACVLLFYYLQTRQQLAFYREEVMRGRKTIAMQRSVIDRVLAEQGERLTADERIRLRLELITSTANKLKESQPEMALFLLVDAVEISRRDGLDVPSEINSLIRSLLVSKDAEVPEGVVSAIELADLAKQQIAFPFSREQATVFGRPADDVLELGGDQADQLGIGSGD